MEEIVNKVAQSSLESIDLEEYCDTATPREYIDVKDQLFQGMILREKDFRTYIKETNWSEYQGKYVGLHCSADAIIPTWAYMLLTSALEPFAKKVVIGGADEVNFAVFKEFFDREPIEQFENKRLVIKGCGDFHIPPSCYVYTTEKLQNKVLSIMYGEPCSTVPVYKRKKI